MTIYTSFKPASGRFRHPVGASLLALGLAIVGTHGAQAQIYVIDFAAGTDGRGALFAVDSNGQRSIISDFGDPGQGPELGRDPFAIAWDGTWLLVVDQSAGTDCTGIGRGCGALFRVDPSTGDREMWNDFGDASEGPLGMKPYGVAIDGDGNYLVSDQDAGVGFAGAVFRVSKDSKTRDYLSRFWDPAEGPTGGNPSGIAVANDGSVLVADPYPTPLVFSIDPVTGNRTPISDLTDLAQGEPGEVPINVEVASPSTLWVLDQLKYTGPNGYGQLLSVDGASGFRTVVSDFSDAAQGPLGFNINDVRANGPGSVLVMDFDAGTNSDGALFAVDTTTGLRSIVSDFGDPLQGDLGVEPSGVVSADVLPPGSPTLTVAKSGTGAGSLTSNPGGIDCGTDCSEAYPLNQDVVLQAVPAGGSYFEAWSGDAECVDGTVTIAADTHCVAVFTKKSTKIFDGADLVSISPTNNKQTFLLVDGPAETVPSDYRVVASVFNKGLLPASSSIYRVYLSKDRKLSADDTPIGEQVIPALAGFYGGGYPQANVNIDTPVLNQLAGTYYVISVVDATNAVSETSENNNIGSSKFTFPCQHYPLTVQCVPK